MGLLMPFKSEKQRRYLWANEPEIARDWTDTYGSGIAKALGGRIGFFRGAQADTASGRSMSPGTSASGGQRGGGGPPGGGDRQMTYTAPHVPHRDTGPTVQQALIEGARKKSLADEIARQQAEKDYRDIRYMAHDFGNYGLQGQQKINEYQPTFGQRFKTGIGNLFSGLGGGLRNLAGFVNPLAFAIDNPYARLGINYLGKKFAPNLYNKWSNQDPTWTDPDEERDILRELNMRGPYTSNYLQNLDLSGYDEIDEIDKDDSWYLS